MPAAQQVPPEIDAKAVRREAAQAHRRGIVKIVPTWSRDLPGRVRREDVLILFSWTAIAISFAKR
jgi:hypothetical protein